MGLMNSLSRGISQAANAGADIYARGALEDQRAEIQAARDARLAELQEQSGIRTENRADARANKQRTDQTARIDAAAGNIAEKAVEGKRGLINSRIDDKSSWTPEQQAAVDQSLAIDKKTIAEDDRTREKAAVRTGDIPIKDAAQMNARGEIAAVKNNAFMEKLAYMNDKADKDRASRELLATMRTINRGGGGDGGGGETAKIKTANMYLKVVNEERAEKKEAPITFEEAFNIANYRPNAEKPNPDDSIRARLVTKLIEGSPRLATDPAALEMAVTNSMKAIKGPDGAAPAANPNAAKPTAAPAAAKTRPPLSSFQK